MLIHKNNDRASISLWVAFLMPVFLLIFVFFFLNLTYSYNYKRFVQNSGDLASLAGIIEIDPASMLMPVGGGAPVLSLNEEDAIIEAQNCLNENLSRQSNYFTADIEALIAANNLSLDPSTNRPSSSTEEGVAIIVLEPSDINPLTGTVIGRESILIIVQARLNTVVDNQIITTYSLSTL